MKCRSSDAKSLISVKEPVRDEHGGTSVMRGRVRKKQSGTPKAYRKKKDERKREREHMRADREKGKEEVMEREAERAELDNVPFTIPASFPNISRGTSSGLSSPGRGKNKRNCHLPLFIVVVPRCTIQTVSFQSRTFPYKSLSNLIDTKSRFNRLGGTDR